MCICSFLVWKNACLNYREFDLEGDLVGVPHPWYLSAQSFITLLKLIWGEYDIVAMNEWKKKCVGLHRTWVSKRTVHAWRLKRIILQNRHFINAKIMEEREGEGEEEEQKVVSWRQKSFSYISPPLFSTYSLSMGKSGPLRKKLVTREERATIDQKQLMRIFELLQGIHKLVICLTRSLVFSLAIPLGFNGALCKTARLNVKFWHLCIYTKDSNTHGSYNA